MKLGRVIGTVVSTKKHESLERRTLLLVEPMDEYGSAAGPVLVAVDTVQAGVGDEVLYEGGKEAAQALSNWFNPCDASILGIVDGVDLEGRE